MCKTWARGKPAKLKAHLANKCLPCPPDISKFWKDTLATEVVNYSRSKKNPTTPLPGIQPYITDHFGSKKPLPLFVTERIDHALLKAWFEAKLSPYDLPYVEEMDTPELWWGLIKNKPSHLSQIIWNNPNSIKL
ncbi:10520_t:CDS:2 [Entrophospora sp. SA101]|nr:10520_t:CDS:2 [Entrophospora sp. SA101]